MPDGGRLLARPPRSVATLPNLITLGRLCAVPLAVWLVLQHRLMEAFVLFAAAGASDAVDGWLARRGKGSALGAMLDPVADKALLVSMFVTLAAVQILPDWIAILVVFRDVMIVGGVVLMALLGQPIAIRPLFVSKLNTVLQIALVGMALLLAGFGLHAPLLLDALIGAVAFSTLASGAAYLFRAARH